MRRYDLAVIGGGTAGLVAAHGAAGVGARVCLIERDRPGGECLWTGCVPSKGLLAAADTVHRMRTADAVGLAPVEVEVDLARILARIRRTQQRLAVHDSAERLRDAGVEVIQGDARFTGPRAVAVEGRTIGFRTALIATGSRPLLPPIEGLETSEPLTTDTVWELEALPPRLLVLGGGPVGCELAQAFARLGSRVTLVEMADRLLPGDEPEVGALLAERLTSEGVDVRTATRGVRVTEDGAGRQLVVSRPDEAEEAIGFEQVLVATGRGARTTGLGVDTAGVAVRDDGTVVVDELLRTSNRAVFAAGDVTGAAPFTHVAGYHGGLVVTNALFRSRRKADLSAVPWAIFTDPEVGRVGLTEAQARRAHGDGVITTRYDYEQLDRAVTVGRAYGFAKLIADPRGRLVGATVAAPAGGETIAELAAWVARGGRLRDVSQTVRAYPTFAEGPKHAADEHLRTVFLSPRTRRLARPVLAGLRWFDR